MDILVTGATGFVGARLCRSLIEAGHTVTAFHRTSSDLTVLRGLPIGTASGDLTDPGSLDRAVRGHEAVIHAAAHLSHWTPVSGDTTHERVNVAGTRALAAACMHGGVRRLVHISSVAAVGLARDNRPADETLPFNLAERGLRYHLSKRRAEDEVLAAVREGLDAVIVNPGSICGPHRGYFRGGEVCAQVVRSRIVPYYLGGRNVVHVDDVVEGILAALRRGRTGERYILGGENLTWLRMAEVAADVYRLKRLFVPVPSLVTGAAALALERWARITGKRPRISYEVHYNASRCWFYSSTKAETELGYRARGYREIVLDYSRFRSARLN